MSAAAAAPTTLVALKKILSTQAQTNTNKRKLVAAYCDFVSLLRRDPTCLPTQLSLSVSEGSTGATLQDDSAATDGNATTTSDGEPVVHAVSSSLRCNTCALDFTEVDEMRSHFRELWHQLNVKRKQGGKQMFSQEEAETYLDSEQAAEESVSGSDSDDISGDEDVFSDNDNGADDGRVTGVAKVASATVEINLKDGLVATCWSAMVRSQEELDELASVCRDIGVKFKPPVNKKVSAVPGQLPDKAIRWAIFLYTAGHFAAGLFTNGHLEKSRTFHRYVVRAKQGGAQSANDNAKGKAKSAGASIRRYNEAMLLSEIKSQIEEWAPELAECSRIFISSSKRNRPALFKAPQVFTAKDSRLRSVPFPTKRPTVNETKRTLKRICLARVHDPVLYPVPVPQQQKVARKPPTPVAAVAKEVVEKVVEEEVPAYPDLEIHHMCTEGVEPSVVSAWLEEEEQHQELNVLINIPGVEGLPILHLASTNGHAELVTLLLKKHASPVVRDTRGRLAFSLAQTKKVRDAFRVFRGKEPELWDYDESGIGDAITDETEEKRLQKQRAKKKSKANKKKKDKQQAKVDAERAEVERVAREKADREAAVRCTSCAEAMLGPSSEYFARLEYTYCSSKCMQVHRRVLQAEAAELRMQGR